VGSLDDEGSRGLCQITFFMAQLVGLVVERKKRGLRPLRVWHSGLFSVVVAVRRENYEAAIYRKGFELCAEAQVFLVRGGSNLLSEPP
jgi:hypothetical protein